MYGDVWDWCITAVPLGKFVSIYCLGGWRGGLIDDLLGTISQYSVQSSAVKNFFFFSLATQAESFPSMRRERILIQL